MNKHILQFTDDEKKIWNERILERINNLLIVKDYFDLRYDSIFFKNINFCFYFKGCIICTYRNGSYLNKLIIFRKKKIEIEYTGVFFSKYLFFNIFTYYNKGFEYEKDLYELIKVFDKRILVDIPYVI